MSLIVILIAYYLDYKHQKKQFVSDLKGGFLFLIILSIIFLTIVYILNFNSLYAILGVGIFIPFSLLLRHFGKK